MRGPQARRGWTERWFGAAAEPAPARPPGEPPASLRKRPQPVRQSPELAELPVAEPTETPRSVRWAAVVVALESLALAVLAVVWLYLTVTSRPDSVRNAVGEVVFVALGAVLLGLCARGLWRVASWARGPVVALQLLLGLLGYTVAFQWHLPAVGIPMLAPPVVVLYLLATPEARLAWFRRS